MCRSSSRASGGSSRCRSEPAERHGQNSAGSVDARRPRPLSADHAHAEGTIRERSGKVCRVSFAMPSRLTIHQRAHLAILLSAGFYALALGVCLLLASIIWLQIVTAHLIPAILIACGGGIVVILKGVFPQPDK